MIVLGTVQRLVMNDGAPFMEHRTRDLTSLLTETEWGWSRDADEAYIFPLFEPALLLSKAYEQSATDHAAALKAAGDTHAQPFVYGSQAEQEARERRDRRESDRVMTALRSAREVSPAESFAALEKRGLA